MASVFVGGTLIHPRFGQMADALYAKKLSLQALYLPMQKQPN